MNWYLKYLLLNLVGWVLVFAVAFVLAEYMTQDNRPVVNSERDTP